MSCIFRLLFLMTDCPHVCIGMYACMHVGSFIMHVACMHVGSFIMHVCMVNPCTRMYACR